MGYAYDLVAYAKGCFLMTGLIYMYKKIRHVLMTFMAVEMIDRNKKGCITVTFRDYNRFLSQIGRRTLIMPTLGEILNYYLLPPSFL